MEKQLLHDLFAKTYKFFKDNDKPDAFIKLLTDERSFHCRASCSVCPMSYKNNYIGCGCTKLIELNKKEAINYLQLLKLKEL